jgi:hypothetical protein
MKRFVYLFAIALILQLSWGVASAYCLHETGQASQHFGHHQHQHQASQDGSDGSNGSSPKKAPVHPDCASCVHNIAVVPSLALNALSGVLSTHEISAPVLAQPAPFLGAPERPQWFVAA